jgi:hypothetical protein
MKLIRLWRVEPKDIFKIASSISLGIIARFSLLIKSDFLKKPKR